MFQRILVPLDGSARAERAVPVAARLAHAGGGSVVLVEIANRHIEYGPYRDPDTASLIAIDRDYDDAVTYLTSLATGTDLAGVPVETYVLAGSVAETILDEARIQYADAIVLTSHGRTGFVRWVLGSVAQKVVRRAPMPVLLLHDAGPTLASSAFEGIGRLRALVPLDGSLLSETALVPATELVRALAGPEGAALHLLRVAETPARQVRAEALDVGTAPAYLEDVAERLRRGPLANVALPVTWSVACSEDPARVIVETADDRAGMDADEPEGARAYDVIVMATHGRGGLERLALGSVTERVVDGTRRPILITRPQHAAAE
jgi:nucleotide-binding universal stress UspA family protein